MFYKPQNGHFKDDTVIFHNGHYYMFSMYSKNESETRKDEEYCNVWLAVSDDGVHWKDYGIVISAPFRVYAMAIYKAGDVFYLNHGSYSDNGCQNVLRFWKSKIF